MGELDRFFFFNQYTTIPLPADLKIWIGFAKTTTLPGLFIHFISKRVSSKKHRIIWAAVIKMRSRITPSIQALR